MTDNEQDPAEYGRSLAEAAARRLDPVSMAQSAAAVALLCDLYQLLVERNVLTQADAVARLEKVSNSILSNSDAGDSRSVAVALIDMVRNSIADETEREPS